MGSMVQISNINTLYWVDGSRSRSGSGSTRHGQEEIRFSGSPEAIALLQESFGMKYKKRSKGLIDELE